MELTRAKQETNTPKRKKLSEKKKDMVSGYLYIAPFFIVFAVIGLYPAIFSIVLAFQKWNGFGYFLNMAMIKFTNFFRVSIFMPYITSMVAVALVFGVFFSSNEAALANYVIGWFGIDPVNWKTSEWGAKIAISLMVFWRWVGYNTIIYLAGLQSIPKDLYEAATIDGANKVQQFFHITIPLLKPFILLTVFMSTVGAMQHFDEPTVFLGSSAFSRDEAMTVVMYLYRDAFSLNSFGTASATAVLLLIIIVIVAALNTWLTSGSKRKKGGLKHAKKS